MKGKGHIHQAKAAGRVANPVRQRRGGKHFGRGCKPRPAKKGRQTFRTGLQTPSGKETPSGVIRLESD